MRRALNNAPNCSEEQRAPGYILFRFAAEANPVGGTSINLSVLCHVSSILKP
jgi:hypothetical protein